MIIKTVTFSPYDLISPIILVIFVDLFYITYPLITIGLMILFRYRKNLILYNKKRMLKLYTNFRTSCDNNIKRLKDEINTFKLN